MRKLLAAVLFLAVFMQTAHAATLSNVQGKVLVNKGTGFVEAQPGMEIAPGDRVLVQPGGSAQVTYPNGAVGSLQPGGIFTLPATPPPVPVGEAAAAGAGGINTALVVGGIAILGVGGWLIYEATNSSSSP